MSDMQAVEFKSKPHDNVVDLPANLRDWNNRPVRVILLADEDGERPATSNTFKAISLKTRDFQFDRNEANAR
jgi:hypothetical protein